jgi:hypothetical protein
VHKYIFGPRKKSFIKSNTLSLTRAHTFTLALLSPPFILTFSLLSLTLSLPSLSLSLSLSLPHSLSLSLSFLPILFPLLPLSFLLRLLNFFFSSFSDCHWKWINLSMNLPGSISSVHSASMKMLFDVWSSSPCICNKWMKDFNWYTAYWNYWQDATTTFRWGEVGWLFTKLMFCFCWFRNLTWKCHELFAWMAPSTRSNFYKATLSPGGWIHQ